ncbi:uncharacterized protein LOC110704673 [Chenopodium quinoa]|uniref:uncharacterized protein LOC110704673 n=1 Tax=Chenopodium quinoa TaxID=63459 RepID=UPI000B78D8FB|nr:uncharacterized protein LOC110704673 [Chenopodium quinoa]
MVPGYAEVPLELLIYFFADDSILFVGANVQEFSVIADIISKYERASGQKVNLSKTDVTFNKNVNTIWREEIIEILGVQEVEKHEKYLGLPTTIGRSKKVIFAGLKERLWKKLQGWKEELLSRSGKEILIKAILVGLHRYGKKVTLAEMGSSLSAERKGWVRIS